MAQRLRVLPINSCQSELGDHRSESYRDPVVGDLIMAQSNVRAALAHLQSDCVVAEGIDQFAHGASNAARIEGLWNTAVLENRDDCVISSLSYALQVAERRRHQYRTEDFLADDLHIGPGVGEHRRLNEVAAA